MYVPSWSIGTRCWFLDNWKRERPFKGRRPTLRRNSPPQSGPLTLNLWRPALLQAATSSPSYSTCVSTIWPPHDPERVSNTSLRARNASGRPSGDLQSRGVDHHRPPLSGSQAVKPTKKGYGRTTKLPFPAQNHRTHLSRLRPTGGGPGGGAVTHQSPEPV